MNTENESPAIGWKRILLFLILATSISNVFRFDIFELEESLKQLPTWLFILSSVLLEGIGVIIGALVAIFFLKKERKTDMSLLGTSKSKGLLMAPIPILLLTAIGVSNEHGLNAHIYGLIASFGTMIYCIMEEYGWRGYLQEELKSIEDWKKYIAIGFLWYFWHLTFLTSATIGDNLFFLAMMIFGSWGIGQVAEATKSVLASACFHLIIQIMMFNALIRNGIDGTEKMIVLGVSVVIWMAVVKKWEKENLVEKQLID